MWRVLKPSQRELLVYPSKRRLLHFPNPGVCSTQRGKPYQDKDQFYQDPQNVTNTARYKEKLILCGDFNGHVGCERDRIENVVGAFSVGDRSEEGGRIIYYGLLNRLAIMNTFYKHR